MGERRKLFASIAVTPDRIALDCMGWNLKRTFFPCKLDFGAVPA